MSIGGPSIVCGAAGLLLASAPGKVVVAYFSVGFC